MSPVRRFCQNLLLATAIIGSAILGTFASIIAVILSGGWVLAWMMPSIPFEFASIISGLGLFVTGLLLVVVARVAGTAMADQRFQNQDKPDDTETDTRTKDDDDYEREEVAEWMAERIADMTYSKMKQLSAIFRS